MKRYVLLMAVLLGTATAVFLIVSGNDIVAQEKEEGDPSLESDSALVADAMYAECYALVESIYAKYQNPPSDDTVSSFTCRTTVDLVDTSRIKSSITEIAVLLNNHRMHVTGDMIELYRDTGTVVAVIPNRQEVHLYTNVANPEYDEIHQDYMTAMRDSLVTGSQVVGCDEWTDSAGVAFRTVELSPNPEIRRRTRIKSITLTVNLDNGTVRAMRVVPMYPELYTAIQWEFLNHQFLHVEDVFAESIPGMVLDGGQRLRPQYKGYTLKDSRYVASAE